MAQRRPKPDQIHSVCEGCRGQFDRIIEAGNLVPTYRPVADLAGCGILGYLTEINGSWDGVLYSWQCMSCMARQFGMEAILVDESLKALTAHFRESGASGLLFVTLDLDLIGSMGREAVGLLSKAVRSADCNPDQIAVIVTGTVGPDSAAVATGIAKQIVAQGFKLASKSLACARAEQISWAKIPPHYVLANNLFDQRTPAERRRDCHFASLIRGETARGRRVVVGGIDSFVALQAMLEMDIAYVAGDFIGKPSPMPSRALSAAAHKAILRSQVRDYPALEGPSDVLRRLLFPAPTVQPTSSADQVFGMFERDPALRAIAVVKNEAPQGLIARYEMVDNMARPYRHELYGRKACTRFMDPQPLMVDISTPLQELATMVVDADPRHLISGFIITQGGRYLGMGSVQDLIREVTAMQMEAARYSNPLTELPGNVPINQHIDNLLAVGHAFCVCYCDLDNFKPFNDVYGYAKGDAVIKLTARLLAGACDPEIDFIGHIGGDDFVLILRSADWAERCQGVLDRFAKDILAFFSNDDIERCGYVTENRKGQLEFQKLTSLSIGVVEVCPGMFSNHLHVATVAAEVKRRAKAIPGNSLWENRRQYVAS